MVQTRNCLACWNNTVYRAKSGGNAIPTLSWSTNVWGTGCVRRLFCFFWRVAIAKIISQIFFDFNTFLIHIWGRGYHDGYPKHVEYGTGTNLSFAPKRCRTFLKSWKTTSKLNPLSSIIEGQLVQYTSVEGSINIHNTHSCTVHAFKHSFTW